MSDNVGYTPGAGSLVATDDVGGVHYQVVKADWGGDGASVPATGDGSNGLDVDVTRVQGNVTVVQGTATSLKVDASGVAVPVTDNSGSLTVDAPASAPLFVRPSDGTNPLSALPVSGTVAATQSGTWNIATVTAVTGPVPVTDNSGSLTVDDGSGSLTVDGSVTAAQGSAAALSGAWPVKVSDGSASVGITDVSGSKALKVDVIQSVGSAAQTDKGAFTEGSGNIEVVGGVYNETISSDPSEDQAAALRITAKRGLHVNLRNSSGTEVGTAGAALRVDPTGATTQPTLDTNSASIKTAVELLDDAVATIASATPSKGVLAAGHDGTNARAVKVATDGSVAVHDNSGSLTVDGTVTANQGGAPWSQNITQLLGVAIVAAAAGILKVGVVDGAGALFSDSNPLPVKPTNYGKTPVRKVNTFAAAETDIAIWTPGASAKFVIESILISATGAGVLRIFDNSNSAANTITLHTLAVGNQLQIVFPSGHPSSAPNNVLRYSTGAGAAGDITVFGYEVS